MAEYIMKRGDVIRYVDMTISEGFSIQHGMNYNVKLYPVKRTRERVAFKPTSPVYGR